MSDQAARSFSLHAATESWTDAMVGDARALSGQLVNARLVVRYIFNSAAE